MSCSNALRRKSVNSALDISPEPIANSRCLIDPDPQTFPSIATLEGGTTGSAR
jgi:hypothetical protein